MTGADYYWPVTMLVAVLGLAFGSFANVVIWRLPRGKSLSTPPSACPKCGARIAWYDNVPVASWLMLRGRCRNPGCGQPISMRYPIVEVTSALLWLLAWHRFGTSWATPFAVAFFYLLLVLSVIDLDVRRLPNPLVAALALVGVAGVAASLVTGQPVVPLVEVGAPLGNPAAAAAVGAVAGGGLSLTLALAYERLRKREGFGMGDVKLLGVLGLFLGPYVLLSQLLASLLGIVAAVAAAKYRRVAIADIKMPFGPALAAAAVLTVLVGPQLWGWYRGLIV